MATIHGNAWKFGDHVSTDVIHPPEFFSLDPDRVRQGLFRKLDPTIQPRLEPGDIIVAGRNFGCGSSRETSVQSLNLNRVGAIIAADFARIFFRSATNNGLPCLAFADPEDVQLITTGETLHIQPDDALLTTSSGRPIPLDPPGSFVRRIWAAGGLLGLLPSPGTPPEPSAHVHPLPADTAP